MTTSNHSPSRKRDRTPSDELPIIPSVLATLPACPGCGAKDRSLKVNKTYRPFGPSKDYKIHYTRCRRCGSEFKIEWE